MEHQKISAANIGQQLSQNLSRRGFLSLASISALVSMLPAQALAQLAEKYPSVRAGIDALVASGKYPNAFVAIGTGLNAPDILTKGSTTVGGTSALDINTLWRVYSMTKPVTGMAAMILVDEGKIKLDQPIADFLPEFANMTVLTDPEKSLDAVPAKTQITLRHLLTHTAGLGYSIITKGPLLQAYLDNGITPGAVSRKPLPGFPKSAPIPDIDTFSKRLAALPLIAEPGTKWSYSVSVDLLGHLIGVISGMKFEDFLQTRIFGPLKMNSSYFQVPESEVGRLVDNYAALGPVLFPIDPAKDSVFLDKPAFAFGGAGLVTSTADYDRFLTMLLNDGSLDGANILSPKMVALGTSNLLPGGVKFDDGKAGFGAGGRVGLGQNEGEYGWGGAAGTVAAVQRKFKFRGIGMTQVMGADNMDLQRGLAQWVIKDLLGG
jgi:CubicO group peptidase (beta-lactamase class C family)